MLIPVMKAALKKNIATGCAATFIGLSGIAQCMAGSSQEFNLPAMNFYDTLGISAAQEMNIPAVRKVECAVAPALQPKRVLRRNILKSAPYFGDEKFLRLLNDEKTGVIYFRSNDIALAVKRPSDFKVSTRREPANYTGAHGLIGPKALSRAIIVG